uniref:hypothetical protein n=1 Tax=Sphingorhabdus sp. TaxID=1902408 RepID=UPI0035932F05
DQQGIAGLAQAKKVFRKATKSYSKFPGTHDGFVSALCEVCFGKEKPYYPSGPDVPEFANPELAPCRGLGAEISTVVGAATICRLMSFEDKLRLADVPFGINIPTAYPDRSGDCSWITSFGAISEADRSFTIERGKNHGRPLVWFTRREEIEALRSHPRAALGLADLLRDYLGLIHHKPTIGIGAAASPNHLFLLHYPCSVANDAGHWRPSFVEGIDNRRFKAHRKNKSSAWGGTVDLEAFQPGGSERVLLSLQAERFATGERIVAEYLGVVRSTRGTEANVDDDDAFIKHIARRRNSKAFVETILGPKP